MAEDLAEGHPAEPEEGAGGVGPTRGWRPDPFGRHRFRHWDGTEWTAYVSDGRSTSWDAEPLTPLVERPVGLPGIVTAIGGFVVGVVLAYLSRRLVGDVTRPVELLVSSVGLWIGLLGSVVLVSTRRGTGSLVRDVGLRFRWSDLGFGLGASIAARMVAGVTAAPIPLPHRRLGESDRVLLQGARPSTWGWVIIVAVICVGAPLIEEIYFRGLVQSRLATRFGPVIGIAVASVLFGAAHLISWDGPLSLVNALAIAGSGIVLGVVYWSSGRLGTSIATHAFFNVQAMIAIALLT